MAMAGPRAPLRRTGRSVHRALIAIMAALALSTAGCGSGNDEPVPGVTDRTITIGSHHNLTGPGSPGDDLDALASRAYFDYVNDRGGVNGRQIIYIEKDVSNDPANAVTAVRDLVEEEEVFAIFNGSSTRIHQAVVGYLNANKVPDLFPDSGCPCWNDPARLPYTFGWQPDFRREGKILGSYATKNFPNKKIAYFYQDDGYGRSGVAGLDTVIPPSQVVTRQTYQRDYEDVTRQARAIVQAKADVIVAYSLPSYTALLLRAQEQLGSKTQLIVNSTSSDPATLSRFLAPSQPQNGGRKSAGALIEGIVTNTYLTPIADTSNSWVRLLKRIRDQYLPNEPVSRDMEKGVATAYSFVQALQQAGRNLTRESLVAAIERGGLSPGFGLTPLSYSRTDHGGYTGTQIATIRNGVLVPQGQPLVTDDADGPIVPYTRPQAPAPASGIPTP